MPIALLLLFVLSFVSSRLHLQLTNNLPLMAGVLLMCIDLIIQVVRASLKKNHYSTLLGSVALTFLSIGYLFKWRLWNSAAIYAGIALAIGFAYVVYWVVINHKVTVRFCVTLIIFMTLLAYTWMPRSTFLCFKLNMNPKNPKAPVATLHKLAWYYNTEGKVNAAYGLLERSYDHVTEKLNEIRAEKHLTFTDTYYKEIFEQDSAILSQDMAYLINNHWEDFTPLNPDDYP